MLKNGACQGKNFPSHLEFEIRIISTDDDFMFDDMQLNAKQLQIMNAAPGELGSAILGFDFKWLGGEMPFKICNVTIKDPVLRKIILDSIIYFNKENCGCFYIR